MEIKLYKTKDDNRVLNKTLTDELSKQVELLSDYNFDDLNIRLTGVTNTLAYNYLYVPKLNKYYFITDVTYYAKNTVIIKCHIDVLMTFKTEILTCKGLLNNFSENKYPFSDNYNAPLDSEPKYDGYTCYRQYYDKEKDSYVKEPFTGFSENNPINVLVVVNDRKDTTT